MSVSVDNLITETHLGGQWYLFLFVFRDSIMVFKAQGSGNRTFLILVLHKEMNPNFMTW